MSQKFLPVGSVVLLKEATRAIVIIGYAVKEADRDQIWDYLGCAYPIGVVNEKNNLLFNHEQIEQVIAEGYSDEEGKKVLKMVEDQMEKVRK